MNAIAPISAIGGTFAEMERLAVAIAKSGLFGMKTPEQALVLMAISQAEGRHPALAARDYDVISGRPAKKAEAMMRDFLLAGGKCEWHAITDRSVDATFSHPQGGSARISWDMERAAVAGLGARDNWKKFPRQMLRSRVVSEGVRTVWPLATSGLYVPEEADDMPPKREAVHAGPTIEVKAEPPRVKPMLHATTEPHDERMAKLAPTYDTPTPVDDDAPQYPFATKKGGRIFTTGSEWMENWRRTVEACKRTDALDKLADAAAMNQGPITAVGEFDPAAAAEVCAMLAEALPPADNGDQQ